MRRPAQTLNSHYNLIVRFTGKGSFPVHFKELSIGWDAAQRLDLIASSVLKIQIRLDPVIFGLPDPVLFSTDPILTFNNKYIFRFICLDLMFLFFLRR